MQTELRSLNLLRLLQLVSPSLPIGAYSYSEGLEYLVHTQAISDRQSLQDWLEQELHYGAVAMEAAVVVRAYHAWSSRDRQGLNYWNDWLSATRETEEMRLSSWQMGQSLLRLWRELPSNPEDLELAAVLPTSKQNQLGQGCNLAIAFGVVAAAWQIELNPSVNGFLFSWLANAIGSGVKLIPLGQTAGQQLLFTMSAQLTEIAAIALERQDQDLNWCGWGVSLASMRHETLYSRLFRS